MFTAQQVTGPQAPGQYSPQQVVGPGAYYPMQTSDPFTGMFGMMMPIMMLGMVMPMVTEGLEE